MYLIDSEFVVMIIFFMLTALFINGNNITLIFLNHQSWYTFSKTLFISMLMVSSIVYFNLYQSSSRIKFNLFNITFVTLYILILLYFFSSLCYVIFELPFKKLIRLFLDPNSDNLEKSENNGNNEFVFKNIYIYNWAFAEVPFPKTPID